MFTFPVLWLLARGYLRQLALWVTLVVAAVLFSPSIALVQVPIQQALNAFWIGTLGVPAIQANLILVALPSVFVSGLVQETAKLLFAMLGLRLLGGPRGRLNGLALGAASGAGYGGFEAFWVSNIVFGMGFGWATVQLAGPAALLAFFERSATVPFHVGAASLSPTDTRLAAPGGSCSRRSYSTRSRTGRWSSSRRGCSASSLWRCGLLASSARRPSAGRSGSATAESRPEVA